MRRLPVWAFVVGLVFGAAAMIIFYLTAHRGGVLGSALLTFVCGFGLAERGIEALGGWKVARPGWTTGPFVRLYAKMGSLIVVVLGLALHEFWVEGFR